MKALSAVFLFISILSQSACSILEVQGEIPSIARIDTWLADDEYGRALASLEHIPANTPDFAAYVSKRKQAESLAADYEQRILHELGRIPDKEDSASKLSLLDRALQKHPDSDVLRKQHKALLKQHLRRVRKLDAEALLVRAQLLYNKLPLHEQDARESPINISAHFRLQSMRGEISDMHNRLMAMARLLLDDDQLMLANRCLLQARQFPADQTSLSKLDDLQKQVNSRLKAITDKERKQQSTKRKNLGKQLQNDIATALKDQQLVKAGKLLKELGRLMPNNPDYLRLKLQHREKVSLIVKKKISLGNKLYRQEKIDQARKVWEEALKLDPDNKTLQTSILRARHVMEKLKSLRQQQNTSEVQ